MKISPLVWRCKYTSSRTPRMMLAAIFPAFASNSTATFIFRGYREGYIRVGLADSWFGWMLYNSAFGFGWRSERSTSIPSIAFFVSNVVASCTVVILWLVLRECMGHDPPVGVDIVDQASGIWTSSTSVLSSALLDYLEPAL